MKKLFVTVLSFLACGAAYALPVGNPSEASLLWDGIVFEGYCADPCDPCGCWWDALSFRVGFYGDYVFERHLKVDGTAPSLRNNSKIDHTTIMTNAGYLALNFWNRFDVFATLGGTHISMEAQDSVFFFAPQFSSSGNFIVESNTAFSWSAGARATLWECGCTALGIEGQYFQTRPNLVRAESFGLFDVSPDTRFKHAEWQVGLGVSHRIGFFVPYIAAKWSQERMSFGSDVYTTPAGSAFSVPNLKSYKRWGYAVGFSLVGCEKLSVSAEGRFGDERALYVNGQIRF